MVDEVAEVLAVAAGWGVAARLDQRLLDCGERSGGFSRQRTGAGDGPIQNLIRFSQLSGQSDFQRTRGSERFTTEKQLTRMAGADRVYRHPDYAGRQHDP